MLTSHDTRRDKEMRTIRYGIASAIVAMGVFAASASAGSPTEITIKENGGDFFGKVKSSNQNCLEDRTVKVKKVRPGKDEYIAMDTTDSDGKWNTGNTGQDKGKFYAKVKESGACDGAKSETIKL